MLPPILQMKPEALCFRAVRPSVRTCVRVRVLGQTGGGISDRLAVEF